MIATMKRGLHAVVGGDAPDHLAVLGHQRLPALDALRAHAPQVALVGVDELGLRPIGHDGLPVKADAGKDRVDRLGAYAALDGARTDLTQERLRMRPLLPRRPAAAPRPARLHATWTATIAIASQTADFMSVPSLSTAG